MTFRPEYNVNHIDTKHSGFAVCCCDAAVNIQSTVVPNILHEMDSLSDEG
jgi:methyl coenzyme M reductase beta subunit